MKHVKMLKARVAAEGVQKTSSKDLLMRATGKFYTHSLIGEHLVKSLIPLLEVIKANKLSIVEPFCGDGRLICKLLEAASKSAKLRSKQFLIELWELDSEALNIAKNTVTTLAKNLQLKVTLNVMNWDTFAMAPSHFGKYHLCITNPPWDVLKPDNRELLHLVNGEKTDYITELRLQESSLTSAFPLSAPKKKFSGWGMNLSRCGVELSFRLIANDGLCGVVSPSSLLADQMSANLRSWLFEKHTVLDVAFYAAEGRLFANADQPCITIVAAKSSDNKNAPSITLYDRVHNGTLHILDCDNWEIIKKRGFVFPVQFGLNLIGIHNKLSNLPTFKSLETDYGLWAGREVDETGHRRFLNLKGQHLFLKGKMVKRFGLAEQPKEYLTQDGPKIPASVQFNRIVWRDVARPNQKRRIHATIVPSGWVCGNSLHVAYFKDKNVSRLRALLGIINSLVFESQVRANLSTAHVSLGIVRQAHLPNLGDKKLVKNLAETVSACLDGCDHSKAKLEVQVAKAFGLSRGEFAEVLIAFTKLEKSEIDEMLGHKEWNARKLNQNKLGQNIPNHYSGNLSNLDKLIVNAVPPGGNWKNIPESVPSQRLKQIRESFAAGEGSRSTYYGRLSPDAPSYTINTYFSRPGNGCHIHFDANQNRVLSQREAARLQSFPDSFVFLGNNGAINQQIGNAVPPLLAFQIARSLKIKGRFIDLFSGAGGLALGFIWAGWESVLANDISETFLETYSHNIGGHVIAGDIREEKIFSTIVNEGRKARKDNVPLFVLGGPPCQGFSTAGNKRSMNDERNWLFSQYKLILEEIRPDGFVFENVPGLLSMEGGRVYEMICRELSMAMPLLSKWKLQTERYAVPQRRSRVVLIGGHFAKGSVSAPEPITEFPKKDSLFGNLAPAISVKQALSDLPALVPGEDGSDKEYVSTPKNFYQKFMRGYIQAEELLAHISKTNGIY